MLTRNDLKTLLSLLSSDRVTLRGHEIDPIYLLKRKLALMIDVANKPAEEPAADGDSSNITE